MKKEYITPIAECFDLESLETFATVSNPDVTGGYDEEIAP